MLDWDRPGSGFARRRGDGGCAASREASADALERGSLTTQVVVVATFCRELVGASRSPSPRVSNHLRILISNRFDILQDINHRHRQLPGHRQQCRAAGKGHPVLPPSQISNLSGGTTTPVARQAGFASALPEVDSDQGTEPPAKGGAKIFYCANLLNL